MVKDFNQHSLREPVAATIMRYSTKYVNEIAVRIRQLEISKTIKFIQNTSKDFNKGKQMSYEFFDERIDSLFEDEQKFSNMIGYFTCLAIFIACLGLFGISLYVSQQRVKEIGIRTIMGASTINIFYLLTKDFIVLSIISSVIAVPIVIYLLNIWLQNFAYKTEPDIWSFTISAIVALVITVVTVGFRAVKSATINSVESLKYE
jgi:putative ABC transport system permease protein